ncbi:MAG: M20/M25/M40 family metallo-hydrolase [Clostridia bacterium]|nr:M20/M25/M40 family metallo-hydrolase [Clostridia bacterium]
MDLKTICELPGISGREEIVRKAIYDECVAKLGKENVIIDRAGNIIAHKNGRKAGAPHVMVAAHMDEVGLMVVSATEDGLLRVAAIGGIDPRVLVSKRVKVGYGDGQLNGVIGAMAIHQQTTEDRKHVLPISQLYVDIGAKDKAEAEAKAPAGTPIVFDTPYVEFGDHKVLVKALDDRVACYNLLRLLDCDVTGDTDFVFTAQEEVGCRGAEAAAFRINPDIGIALEGTSANDVGDIPENQQVCVLGKGVAVSFMDNATIAQPEMFREMMETAKAAGIPHHVKMAVAGGNDSGPMQRARTGARTCVLSVPCRYIHSPSTVCDLRDVDAQYQLVKAFLEK